MRGMYMQYIIGVDSGGTSTKAAAYNLNGELLVESKTGFGNLLNDPDEALANIRQSIVMILGKLGNDQCIHMVLGIAGVDSGGFRETLEENLSHFGTEVTILNDAWMAYYGLLNGEDGVLVISGTGSIVIGKLDKREDRVGGYGNLLGDEGSGYDIARKMIKSTLNAFDEGREFSDLEEKVLSFGSFETVFELVKFVYSKTKDKISELSMLAVHEAEKGNEEALQLFNEAGEDLANQVLLLIDKLGIKERPKVAVTGSVLLKNDWVFDAFSEKIKAIYPNCKIIRKDQSNTVGAYYYHKNNL